MGGAKLNTEPAAFTTLDGNGDAAFSHEWASREMDRLRSCTQGAKRRYRVLKVLNWLGGGFEELGYLLFEPGNAAGEVGIALFGEHLFAGKLSGQSAKVDNRLVDGWKLQIDSVERACEETQALVDDLEPVDDFRTESQEVVVNPVEARGHRVQATINSIEPLIGGAEQPGNPSFIFVCQRQGPQPLYS